jgi:hypothetical protein
MLIGAYKFFRYLARGGLFFINVVAAGIAAEVGLRSRGH